MSAFLTVTVKIKDPEKFQQYAQIARPTVGPYEGEIVAKGKAVKALAGNELAHDVTLVVKFPDIEALERWYNSDEYQAVIPLRDEAAETNFIIHEEA